jgi:hypothetical protein
MRMAEGIDHLQYEVLRGARGDLLHCGIYCKEGIRRWCWLGTLHRD